MSNKKDVALKRHKYLTLPIPVQAEINRMISSGCGYDEVLAYLYSSGHKSDQDQVSKYVEFLKERDLISDIRHEIDAFRNQNPEERIIAKICALYESYIDRIEMIAPSEDGQISVEQLNNIVRALTRIRATRVSMESVEIRVKQEASRAAEEYGQVELPSAGVSSGVVDKIYEKVLGVNRTGTEDA